MIVPYPGKWSHAAGRYFVFDRIGISIWCRIKWRHGWFRSNDQ